MRTAATSHPVGTLVQPPRRRTISFADRTRASSDASAPPQRRTRRLMLVVSTSLLGVVLGGRVPTSFAEPATSPLTAQNQNRDDLQKQALAAFNARDFPLAARFLERLISAEPGDYVLREALGQCFVDGGGVAFGTNKEASEKAVREYSEALRLAGETVSDRKDGNEILLIKARLLAGRALAFEVGLEYQSALVDYDDALATALQANAPNDPLIVNQKANVLAALGDWQSARTFYVKSANGFRDSSRKTGGTSGDARFRANGVAFASTNAALALAQMGDFEGAERELRSVSRRAPQVVDTRAALAALYWKRNSRDDAEREWEFACDLIDTGCGKYRDKQWLTTVRRWPPLMVDALQKFLTID